MIVYGLFQCYRYEGEHLLGVYKNEEDAKVHVEDFLSQWDGHTRWGRITNRSHDLGPCLRAIRVRGEPWMPKWHEDDNFVSRAYTFMFAIVPLEVK